MKTVSKQEAGFTLIEILLAIAILAFGLLAIASMQVMAIQTTGKAGRITEGATLAMNQLERFMASDYSDISDNGVSQDLYDITWTVKSEDDADDLYKTKKLEIVVTPKHSLLKNDIVFNGIAATNLY